MQQLPPKSVINGCGKAQLALLFFPESVSPDVARRRLMRWIKSDRQLYDRLTAASYRDCQHDFTPMQVKIIYEFLGEPV